ncbi:C58 family peptidase [Microbulbifer sp. OS29]|uniref:C58 family peptidase n=1 Tax=Microbulbifer okhotskensis TaxID=2926617 RepID=A0A9X2J6P6_9GAMM|nr:YopT-type cysteine protease domain-containing protein [Microbulbifer okhotskensis]MCO1336867.1 C58 family peptidase [Microbulbifer okhotskensis]
MFNPRMTETEFLLDQANYIQPGAHNDVRRGVCYALSYMWLRLGLQPGGHLNMHLQVGLQQRFHNTGIGNARNRAAPGRFLMAVGGSTSSFGQPIYSLQRAIAAQQQIQGNTMAISSGLRTIAQRDGYTEHCIARGHQLNRFEPFSTFLKWIRQRAGSLNQGFALIGFLGPNSGHAITIQVQNGNVWRLFDPNFGSFIFQGYHRFKAELHQLALIYLAMGAAGGSWMISTFR